MEIRDKNVRSKRGLFWGALMVVHLKWKCTGTPIVAVKDYPASYRVKDKFGEVHTQCTHRREEGRGAIQGSGRGGTRFRGPLWQQQPESDERLQPPIPPSATQKRRRSKDRRRLEKSRHRVDNDGSGGDWRWQLR